MKKLLAAALLLTVVATPAFAARKPKQPYVKKYDYRQHKPNYKYKNPKSHHHAHAHNASKSHSKLILLPS